MVVGMIYNYSELLKKKSRKEIETLVLNKKLYKLETGIYSDTLVGDDLVVYSKKYKSSIVTMESAFYYYDLTDVVPTVTSLATLSNARRLKIKMLNSIMCLKEDLKVEKYLKRLKMEVFIFMTKRDFQLSLLEIKIKCLQSIIKK